MCHAEELTSHHENMTLRRRLTWALARHTRPSFTRGQQQPWSVRCPQNSINARASYRYMDITAGHRTITGLQHNQPLTTMNSRDPAAVAQQADLQTMQPDSVEEEEGTTMEIPRVETWHEAVDAVLEATRTAFPSSPAFDAASPGGFQSYWRDVFARLHQQVTADQSIPEYLTSPPSKAFWINVFAQGVNDEGHSCPCSLPEVEPSVKLENDAGVTKGDLIAGLGGFLYGGGPPRVHVEDDGLDEGVKPDGEGQRTGVLVHGSDWMSEGDDDNGKTYVYTGGWEGRPAMIWMYCCQSGEFEAKAKAKAKAAAKVRDGADGEDESRTMAKL